MWLRLMGDHDAEEFVKTKNVRGGYTSRYSLCHHGSSCSRRGCVALSVSTQAGCQDGKEMRLHVPDHVRVKGSETQQEMKWEEVLE
jgi:hypothetical protein